MQEFQIQLITRDEQVLQFSCSDGEDIVSAAERAQLYLISQCRSGSCGACIGTAKGHYIQAIDPDIASSIAHTNQVLLCRTYPRSDLQVVLPYDAEQVRKQPLPIRQAILLEKNYLTADTLQLKLELLEDDEGNLSLAFEPGQYIEIWIPNTEIKRAYSLANAPNWDGVLELLIKLRPQGQFAHYITEQAQVGDTLTLQGASGNFTLQDRGLRPRYFIAGGCGLASVMSMLRRMGEWQEPHEVQLLFGVWYEDEVFYQQELADLATDYPNLHYQICVQEASPVWQGFHGSVVEAFRSLLQTIHTTPDIYICGSNSLIERIAEIAEEFNISKDQLIYEHYGVAQTQNACCQDKC
ncbi:MAG: 2Fe-2S iron-sulfur cluster binding domain-containing protein [Thiofilum sp.]|uniref:2Fe-2S iron-sulfur cluster binding domain-containing protein n=1 Tax=Thiofilum sp. TaxID=2212733 RepID=UPI0025D68DCA|nr:2Fe-2S iron-sulfur cluster binding domain-containing protein [Thiofilum sp.]MBK8454430.1 2Fe-2S iron-sulfur cluster binding domain-containing protein [Thiofilum sp.]